MFSTHNSALVSYSNGMFTRYSATSTNHTDGEPHDDLIELLSIVQKYNVDFLPITWQPALGNIGKGGSGTISQSTFSTEMPLAFKRYHEDAELDNFLPLISEVLILSQPPIQSHPNIVNLEGICWEIKPRTGKAVPVLVFEKAAWDLHQFMNVQEGMNMSIDGRLKICADIGSAIMALHAHDVIHGDIKPQNVLVFKDATGKTTVRMADFGYSTLAAGESGRVLLPKSRPWNAPEHHFGEFGISEAKTTDVYSFGMLCLWLLFEKLHIPRGQRDTATEFIPFDASTGSRSSLEQLKDNGKLEHIAYQLIDLIPLASLSAEHRIHLKQFFSFTIPLNPQRRTSNVGRLVRLLGQEQTELQLSTTRALEETRACLTHVDFRIAENLIDFVQADYRVRMQIRDSLENHYFKNQNQPCATQIAFQVAFCHSIGFGVESNDTQCHIWLERSNKQPVDLEIEKKTVRLPSGKEDKTLRLRLRGVVMHNLIHEYRKWGLNLEEVLNVYEREAGDMARAFGELHFISLTLYRTIGDLLDELGHFAKSDTLRMRIKDQIDKTDGVAHPFYLSSIVELAKRHDRMGKWTEVQSLYEEILKHWESDHKVPSYVIGSLKNNLALTYDKQGRSKQAEELLVQVMESTKRIRGENHPDTLFSMANLASIYMNLGRWNEAEELLVHVMETMIRVLGQEHPDTLAIMDEVAFIYNSQGQWKEAEELRVKALGTTKRVLGQVHPDTLTTMNNLAFTYNSQGRWKEAEELQVQVMATRKLVQGKEHPDTLDAMSNLASTYEDQGRSKEAEKLEVEVIETSKMVLGEEHPNTLTSMNKLALIYHSLGRLKEAEVMLVQVTETSKRVLGQEHPDTLTNMGNLALIFLDQRRWKEAEELEVQVMETQKIVLGQEHSDTLTSMSNLASTLWNQGKSNEAQQLEVQVMETRKRVFGQEHPDTLSSMANFASTFKEQGRLKEAEELEVQVVEMKKRVLGQEHPDTLISMANFALTLKNQGRLKETEELQVRVMQTRKRVLGPEHPDTLTSMGNLAWTLKNQGRSTEAEVLEVQVMETRRKVLGQEHPHTLISMIELASTFSAQKRSQEAEVLEVHVMVTRKRVLGQEHPDTLTSMSNLASTFRDQDRLKEAEELEVQVLETRRSVLGQEHPDTITSMSNLALMFWDHGRLEEAEELEVQVVEMRKRVLGQDHPDTLTSMSNLASTFRDQERLKEAEELFVPVMEMRKKVLGQDHPDTLISMINVASTYQDQERSKEAESLQVQVVEMSKRILGDEHPDTITSMSNLASTYWDQERLAEAEELEVQVMEIRKAVLGQEHPDTMTSMNKLMSMYIDNGRWKEAKEIRIQTGNRVQTALDKDGDLGTDEETLLLVLAMSPEMDDANDADDERVRRALATAIEVDEDMETNEEQLQHVLAILMEAEKDDDEIRCSKREGLPEATDCKTSASKRLRREETLSPNSSEDLRSVVNSIGGPAPGNAVP